MGRKHKPSPPRVIVGGSTLNDNQAKAMKEADKADAEGRPADVVEIYGRVQGELSERREDEWRRSAIAETVALNAARGDVIEEFEVRRGEQDKPLRRKSGLDWLLSKGRIEPHQMSAGLKYGDDYRASTDVSLRSCCGDSFGGDGLVQMERREEAFKRITRARQIGLSGNETMIALMDLICGEGVRIRDLADTDALSNKKEAVLCIALDLLAGFYGIADAWRNDSSTLSA